MEKTIVTQEILDVNPELVAEGVKVGDEVESSRIKDAVASDVENEQKPEVAAENSEVVPEDTIVTREGEARPNEDGKQNGAVAAAQ